MCARARSRRARNLVERHARCSWALRASTRDRHHMGVRVCVDLVVLRRRSALRRSLVHQGQDAAGFPGARFLSHGVRRREASARRRGRETQGREPSRPHTRSVVHGVSRTAGARHAAGWRGAGALCRLDWRTPDGGAGEEGGTSSSSIKMAIASMRRPTTTGSSGSPPMANRLVSSSSACAMQTETKFA